MKAQTEPKLIQVGKNINLSLPELDKPLTLTIDTKEERDSKKLDAIKLVESYKRSKTNLGKSRIAKKLQKMFTLEQEIVSQKTSQGETKKSKLKEAIDETSRAKKRQTNKSKAISTKSVKKSVQIQKEAPKIKSTVGVSRRAESYRR